VLALCLSCFVEAAAVGMGGKFRPQQRPQPPPPPMERGTLDAVPPAALFGGCLLAVRQGVSSRPFDFQRGCMQVFGGMSPPISLADDCTQFAGRVAEAQEEGYLGRGTMLCGRLARERSRSAGLSLASYVPTEGGELTAAFCESIKPEVMDGCVPVVLPPVDQAVGGGLLRAAVPRPTPAVSAAAAAADAMISGVREEAREVPGALETIMKQAPAAAASAFSGDRVWANLQTLLHRSG